jgi:DNA-binding transcriptional MerR regulator
MGRNGLFIGEVAARSGTTRKALRLYETSGILAAPRRTASGYRIYGSDALALVAFVRHAQRLGFTLEEIGEIVGIRRAGRAPCPHVRDLVRRKVTELDRRLEDLRQVRRGLGRLLNGWRSAPNARAAVCPHIEDTRRTKR